MAGSAAEYSPILVGQQVPIPKKRYVDCTPRAPPPLHIRGDVHPHRHFRCDVGRHHGDGHLSVHQHPGGWGDLVVSGHESGRHGEACSHRLRARHDHHRERHRTYRIHRLQWRRADPCVHASRYQRGSGGRPGNRRQPDSASRSSARNLSAPGRSIRCVQRSDSAVGPEQQRAHRTGTIRLRTELYPHAPLYGSGDFRTVALRRQGSDRHGRSRPRCALRQASIGHRCLECAGSAEPDTADGHRENRPLGISDSTEQQSGTGDRHQRCTDQDGERRAHLHARRGAGARRVFGANQHCSHQRQPLGAAYDLAARRRLHTLRGQWREATAAEDCRHTSHQSPDDATLRSISVRARIGIGSGSGSA